MIIEKILGNCKEYPTNGRSIIPVYLEWYELDKKLLRKKTQEGEEIGIRVGKRLSEGDVLYEDEKKIIVVAVKECELTHVDISDRIHMGRLCFELGNRHLSLAIQENCVETIYDEPTFLYLEKLGFSPKKKMGVFRNFTVCHAHEHTHHHE